MEEDHISMKRWPFVLRSKTCEGCRLHPAEDAGLAYSRLASPKWVEKRRKNTSKFRVCAFWESNFLKDLFWNTSPRKLTNPLENAVLSVLKWSLFRWHSLMFGGVSSAVFLLNPNWNGWTWWNNHFLCKDWVHHPIDSQPLINGCLRFQEIIKHASKKRWSEGWRDLRCSDGCVWFDFPRKVVTSAKMTLEQWAKLLLLEFIWCRGLLFLYIYIHILAQL